MAYEQQEIAQALVRLKQQNHQSDTRFAEEFVQMRVNQGKGSYLISQQLKQKGIENFNFSDYNFFTLAQQVRLKKYSKQAPKNLAEKAKQQRFLQNRGFSFDEINFALKT